jgi:hypothetical protein
LLTEIACERCVSVGERRFAVFGIIAERRDATKAEKAASGRLLIYYP